MHKRYRVAGGSVAGFDHVRAGRNNQDAFAWHQDERCTIAVVCDGCSEGAHSEVGAYVLARAMTEALRKRLDEPMLRSGNLHTLEGIVRTPPDLPRELPLVLDAAAGDVRDALGLLGRTLGGDARATLRDVLLATIVGVVITDDVVVVFACGDGVFAVNGAATALGPFPDNAPPYLAYGLLPSAASARAVVTFAAEIPTAGVESILIGTDGAAALAGARVMHARTGEELGGLAQFLEEERYVRNADMVRRRLTVIGRDGVHANGDPFRLHDDATLVVIRRAKEV